MFKKEFKDNNVTITITSKESLTKDQMKQALQKLADSKALDSKIYKCWICDISGYIKPQECKVEYKHNFEGTLMALIYTNYYTIHMQAESLISAITSSDSLEIHSHDMQFFIADNRENLKAKVENHYFSKVSKIFENEVN